MRRLLLAGLLAAAAIPAAPAHAGPAVCVTAVNFPVCAGTCSPGDPISVIVVGVSASGTASCGGGSANCTAYKTPCGDTTGRASGSGQLTCSGTAPIVICLVGVTAANSPYASLVS